MSSRALRKLQDNIVIPGAEEEQSEEEEVRVDNKKQKGFNAFLLVSKVMTRKVSSNKIVYSS